MKNTFNSTKTNFPSGLVVFLVALPLCLAIALASGAPPLAGIISGIIGGIVVGYISNSHISVTGPAAGLTGIIVVAISDLNGSFEMFLCAGIIAGVVQLILGFIRAGSISNYFPTNVIEGMLAGIGVIIILKQIPNALGYDNTFNNDESLFPNGYNWEAIAVYLENLTNSVHLGAILITIVSLAILILWDKVNVLKKMKMLPGALIAVTVGIVINELFLQTNSSLAIQPNNLVNMPVPKTVDDFKGLITLPNFSAFLNPQVWIIGITIAVVASIETLLCIEAADRLDKQRRITDTNLELKAQGIGNVISSLIGGLPMTSVVVRSSANANAGATSKVSTIIHGILLLVCVLTIPFVLNKIPLATLSAVLLLVGYKLASPKTIKHFWHKGKYQFIPFIATIIAVVSTDLLKGVAIGMAIAVFYILQGNMKRAYYLSREELAEADEITLKLSEEVSFLNKAAIKKTLKNIQPNSKITIDAAHSSYISSDVLDLIQDFTNVFAKENNIEVILIGFRENYNDAFDKEHQHSHVIVEHRRKM